MLKTIQFTVSGRVQGVGFRYAVQHKAQALGITGWIRNRADGNVEGVAQVITPVIAEAIDQVTDQSDGGKLDAFEKWLWVGPKHAAVTNVDSHVIRRERMSGFEITQ